MLRFSATGDGTAGLDQDQLIVWEYVGIVTHAHADVGIPIGIIGEARMLLLGESFAGQTLLSRTGVFEYHLTLAAGDAGAVSVQRRDPWVPAEEAKKQKGKSLWRRLLRR